MIKLEKASLEKLKEYIAGASNILILNHSNPDGDTVGAAQALYLILNKLNKKASLAAPDPLPDFLRWLPAASSVKVFDGETGEIPEAFRQADLLFCMDFNAPHRVGKMSDLLSDFKGKTVLIDHHLYPDEEFFDLMFSYPESSSTSELLYLILKEIGYYELISREIAENLFVGIMTDTGSFAHSCDRSDVFRSTAELIDKGGLKVKAIHDRIYNNFGENRLRFLGYCISSKLVVKAGKKTAYIWVTLDEMEKYGVDEGDLEGLVNYALSIKGIELAVLLKEKKDFIKLSFRSKSTFSVNDFARKYFNGGGHKNASGGRFYDTMENTLKYLESILETLEI